MVSEVAFDMDGVLADFVGGVFRMYGKPVPDTLRWDFFQDELGESASAVFAKCDYGFWLNLDPIPKGVAMVRRAREKGLTVSVITSPVWTDDGLRGKRDWLQRHVPEVSLSRLVFATDKSVCAAPHRLLIDDRNENVDSWNGPVILYPQVWNRGGPDPKHLLEAMTRA